MRHPPGGKGMRRYLSFMVVASGGRSVTNQGWTRICTGHRALRFRNSRDCRRRPGQVTLGRVRSHLLELDALVGVGQQHALQKVSPLWRYVGALRYAVPHVDHVFQHLHVHAWQAVQRLL